MSGSKPPTTAARFFGGLLMVVGVLIAATAGLCSAAVTHLLQTQTRNPSELIRQVWLYGSIPFVIGVALFFIGRALRR
jgi:hypothetical protein